jgi:cyclopropane-fatty-acyl-phospholipid synthase
MIAERLQIDSGPCDILDVGSGWGGLDRFIVRHFPNANIIGITLAKNQIKWAIEKNKSSLTSEECSRITYRKSHYLKYKEGSQSLYDRILAIGMLEHVGLKKYNEFILNTKRLMKPGGRCLIHTIISPNEASPSNKWLDMFIFPGGYTPSLSELIRSIEIEGVIIEGVHIHGGRNYFLTLEHWRQRFLKNWLPRASGEDQLKFGRMWHFYLAVARNMFDENLLRHQIVQIVIKKL